MAVDQYAKLCAEHRWNVPAHFNIAHACCGRWAEDRARFALYWEDESGQTSAHTFWDLQREANRLSNALAKAGVARGDKVALILPQRRETAVAHIAIYQMGAVAVPLSFLFGPDALLYRLENSEARVALVDPQSLPNLAPIRAQLPRLDCVIGVAGADEDGVHSYDSLVGGMSPHFTPVNTRANDPAVIVYTSGTTGPPKGALMPHACLLGNLSGFVHSHNGFPQPGDVFWSPADWAWTGGLMDALLPTFYFGRPIVGYRGRFDPERALRLMEKYQVRNTFLFPTALKLMMKAFPRPRESFDVGLRSIMSAGEAVGTTVFAWTQESLGVTVNEMFGQTEMNYIVGNSHTQWPAKSGSMGRPYPGHRVEVIDDAGIPVPTGEAGEVAIHRVAPDDVFKAAGYRIGPSEIENCLVKHPAVANAAVVPSPDETRGNVVKAFIVLAAGHAPSATLEEEIQQHVRKFLAPYEYPKEIEFIDALPMTTTGKVQRKVLREREAARKGKP
jgi:acetyl-CoA synthetase